MVEADIFSGRPNPEWTMNVEESAEFRRRLPALQPFHGKPNDAAPGLGYRGLTVRVEGGVRLKTLHLGNGTARVGAEAWSDPERSLERWVIGTAKGKIDDGVFRTLETSAK